MTAFIFDMDGTLVDTEKLWVAAMEQHLAEQGYDVPHGDAVDLVCGKSWEDIYAEMTESYPQPQLTREMVNTSLADKYARLQAATDIVITSSVELLRTLARDHAVCIVSGSTRHQVTDIVDMLGIADLLQFTITCEDYSPGKPDPACFFMAAEKFGCDPGSCVVFEDSSAGVQAAKAAGMIAVGLQREDAIPQDMSAADVVLSDLADFELVSMVQRPS